MLKRLSATIVAFLMVFVSVAQSYIPSDAGSSVKFRIKNLGFNVTGSFTGLQGVILFSTENTAAAHMEITVDAATVNTDNNMRDEHLRKEDYFDVKNYPQIRFISTKIARSNKAGTFFITGNLTLKDVTQAISFPFTAVQQPDGYLFTGEFKINRRDFKVGGGSTISDQLTVQLNVFAKKG